MRLFLQPEMKILETALLYLTKPLSSELTVKLNLYKPEGHRKIR